MTGPPQAAAARRSRRRAGPTAPSRQDPGRGREDADGAGDLAAAVVRVHRGGDRPRRPGGQAEEEDEQAAPNASDSVPGHPLPPIAHPCGTDRHSIPPTPPKEGRRPRRDRVPASPGHRPDDAAGGSGTVAPAPDSRDRIQRVVPREQPTGAVAVITARETAARHTTMCSCGMWRPLVDPDPPQPGEAVEPGVRITLVAGQDRADGAPGDPRQLRGGRRGALGGQPGDLLAEVARVPGVVPGPGHRRDHHPVPFARHTRGIGLQEQLQPGRVQVPPPPASRPGIEPRTAAATDPAAATRPGPRTHRHHHDPRSLIEPGIFRHLLLASDQRPQ